MNLKHPPVPVAVSNLKTAVSYLRDAARFYRSHAYKTGDRNRGRLLSLLAERLDRQLQQNLKCNDEPKNPQTV